MKRAWILLVLLVRAASAAAQTPVSPELRINDLGAFVQSGHAVAASRNGDFLVVWEGADGSGDRDVLWGQWYTPAGERIGHNLVLQSSSSAIYQPALCEGPNGGVTVFFRKTYWDQGWDNLVSREVGAQAKWLATRNSLASLRQLAPRFVRKLPQGGRVVSLIGFRDFATRQRTFLLLTDGKGSVTREPREVYPSRRNGQYVGGVAVSPSGEFLVTWSEAFGRSKVLAQLFSPEGRSLRAPVQVHDDAPGNQYVGRVAALGDRGYVVVWDDENPVTGRVDLKMRFLSPDGAVQGPELRVDDQPGLRFLGGDIAADAEGNFFVIWQGDGPPGTSGRGLDVWGRLFRPDGRPIGPSQVLNTYTGNDQAAPTVTVGAGGTFIAVWQSYGQDGDAEGIFGRLFAAAPPDPRSPGLGE